MSDIVQTYRQVGHDLPQRILTWHLYGAGLENFGKNHKPVRVSMPKYGPGELLVRIDAVGICFSDVKVIKQGNKHPRITGRDLVKEPVILGHETAVTVVGVGEALNGKFRVGQRFIVQADVFYQGKSMAYGYVLPGAMTQYGVISREMIEGDEGCYLIPIPDTLGDAEAALTEPWACVVASYRITHRSSIKPGGVAWFVGAAHAEFNAYTISRGIDRGLHPKTVVATDLQGGILKLLEQRAASLGFELAQANGFDSLDLQGLASKYAGFDDIIVLGADADVVEKAAPLLAKQGIMNIVAKKPLARPVSIDVGRVHYDNHLYVGTSGTEVAASYGLSRTPSELLPEGTAWFIGAGGPMGQMHVQRAIQLEHGPRKILATDIDTARLNSVGERYIPIAERSGLELQVVNPQETGEEEFEQLLRDFTGGRGFDDIVVLAPVPALIESAIPHLGERGLMNIFAGLARGTTAALDVSGVYGTQIRFVGSSGSRIADMQDTVAAAEKDRISPNSSVAAIGGIEAAWEGMRAVEEGRFAGKIVIYPQIRSLELTPLAELGDRLPDVYAKFTDGMFWNREAEDELLRTSLKIEARQETPIAVVDSGRLAGKSAIVTGAGQGLGEAIARRLAAEGANVILADVNLDTAQAVAQDIENASSVRAVPVKVDVTEDAQVAELVQTAVKEFAKLDILVSNAGILKAGDITEFTTADWRKVIDVNLVGYFICAREAAKVMIEQKSGVIVQINSKSGKKGSFKNSAYAASKFGGVGLTQSLALELAPAGIRVNAVCPGNLLDSPLWVDSLYEQYAKRWNMTVEEVRRKYEEQVPLGRGCTYDDVADVVVFLASDESSYMTGQAINVTGGQEMR